MARGRLLSAPGSGAFPRPSRFARRAGTSASSNGRPSCASWDSVSALRRMRWPPSRSLEWPTRCWREASEPTRGEVRRMDGTVLKRGALPRGILGGPFVVAMRPALYGALLDAVGVDTITPAAEATGFTVDGDRRHCIWPTAPAPKAISSSVPTAFDRTSAGSFIRPSLHRAPAASSASAVPSTEQ